MVSLREANLAQQYPQILGIDTKIETLLAETVQDVLLRGLPEGWTLQADDEDRGYFWNSLTGESLWQHPDHDIFIAVVDMYRKSTQQADQLGFLREGWLAMEVETQKEEGWWSGPHYTEDEEAFWFNELDQSSVWHNPRNEIARRHFVRSGLMLTLLADAERRVEKPSNNIETNTGLPADSERADGHYHSPGKPIDMSTNHPTESGCADDHLVAPASPQFGAPGSPQFRGSTPPVGDMPLGGSTWNSTATPTNLATPTHDSQNLLEQAGQNSSHKQCPSPSGSPFRFPRPESFTSPLNTSANDESSIPPMPMSVSSNLLVNSFKVFTPLSQSPRSSRSSCSASTPEGLAQLWPGTDASHRTCSLEARQISSSTSDFESVVNPVNAQDGCAALSHNTPSHGDQIKSLKIGSEGLPASSDSKMGPSAISAEQECIEHVGTPSHYAPLESSPKGNGSAEVASASADDTTTTTTDVQQIDSIVITSAMSPGAHAQFNAEAPVDNSIGTLSAISESTPYANRQRLIDDSPLLGSSSIMSPCEDGTIAATTVGQTALEMSPILSPSRAETSSPIFGNSALQGTPLLQSFSSMSAFGIEGNAEVRATPASDGCASVSGASTRGAAAVHVKPTSESLDDLSAARAEVSSSLNLSPGGDSTDDSLAHGAALGTSGRSIKEVPQPDLHSPGLAAMANLEPVSENDATMSPTIADTSSVAAPPGHIVTESTAPLSPDTASISSAAQLSPCAPSWYKDELKLKGRDIPTFQFMMEQEQVETYDEFKILVTCAGYDVTKADGWNKLTHLARHNISGKIAALTSWQGAVDHARLREATDYVQRLQAENTDGAANTKCAFTSSGNPQDETDFGTSPRVSEDANQASTATSPQPFQASPKFSEYARPKSITASPKPMHSTSSSPGTANASPATSAIAPLPSSPSTQGKDEGAIANSQAATELEEEFAQGAGQARVKQARLLDMAWNERAAYDRPAQHAFQVAEFNLAEKVADIESGNEDSGVRPLRRLDGVGKQNEVSGRAVEHSSEVQHLFQAVQSSSPQEATDPDPGKEDNAVYAQQKLATARKERSCEALVAESDSPEKAEQQLDNGDEGKLKNTAVAKELEDETVYKARQARLRLERQLASCNGGEVVNMHAAKELEDEFVQQARQARVKQARQLDRARKQRAAYGRPVERSEVQHTVQQTEFSSPDKTVNSDSGDEDSATNGRPVEHSSEVQRLFQSAESDSGDEENGVHAHSVQTHRQLQLDPHSNHPRLGGTASKLSFDLDGRPVFPTIRAGHGKQSASAILSDDSHDVQHEHAEETQPAHGDANGALREPVEKGSGSGEMKAISASRRQSKENHTSQHDRRVIGDMGVELSSLMKDWKRHDSPSDKQKGNIDPQQPSQPDRSLETDVDNSILNPERLRRVKKGIDAVRLSSEKDAESETSTNVPIVKQDADAAKDRVVFAGGLSAADLLKREGFAPKAARRKRSESFTSDPGTSTPTQKGNAMPSRNGFNTSLSQEKDALFRITTESGFGAAAAVVSSYADGFPSRQTPCQKIRPPMLPPNGGAFGSRPPTGAVVSSRPGTSGHLQHTSTPLPHWRTPLRQAGHQMGLSNASSLPTLHSTAAALGERPVTASDDSGDQGIAWQ